MWFRFIIRYLNTNMLKNLCKILIFNLKETIAIQSFLKTNINIPGAIFVSYSLHTICIIIMLRQFDIMEISVNFRIWIISLSCSHNYTRFLLKLVLIMSNIL